MADIFVSYSKRDKKRVARFVERLENEGWTVFWDTHLLSGDAWARRILAELETARCVVVAWSRSASLSEWVRKEADIASSRRIMVPVSLDGTLPPPGFRDLQAESLRWWRGGTDNAALKRIKISISRMLNPNDPLSKIPPPEDEPLIRFRHILATATLAVVLAATYYFGHDPYFAEKRRRSLAEVKEWGYQLSRFSPAAAALLNPNDMMVIDNSRDGTEAGLLTRAELETLRWKPSGQRRLLLAYLNIGEAESYRYYWNKDWGHGDKLADGAPAWIYRQKAQWVGNYHVKFWEDGWKKIVFSSSNSYLKRVMQQGFDGVYLDMVDTYEFWMDPLQVNAPRSTAKDDMVKFVAELARSARAMKPDFLVVPQNADSLLTDPDYLAAIDGVAREDLVFSSDGGTDPLHSNVLNSASAIQASIDNLKSALIAGKAVFVTEYEQSPRAELAKRGLEGNGFKVALAERTLDKPAAGYGRLNAFEVDRTSTNDVRRTAPAATSVPGTGRAVPPRLPTVPGPTIQPKRD